MNRALGRHYRFGPVRIEVVCDDADTARWLDEFLVPWFARAPTEPPDAVVRLETRPGALEAARGAAGDRTLAPLPCFALDSELIELPGWREGDCWHLLDAERDCVLRLSKDELVITAAPDDLRVRLPLMRGVRELALTGARLRPGIVDLHAAAFAIDGAGVLIAGPKQAGKTTLLLEALVGGGAGLVANDRVLLSADASGHWLRGVPTAVRIRAQALADHPRLRAGDRPGDRPLLHHRDEPRVRHPPAASDTLALAPATLARRLGAGCVARSRLAALVFPEMDAGCEGFRLEPLAAAECARRLRGALYGGRVSRPDTLFERVLGRAPGFGDAELAAIANGVPAWRALLGPDALRRRMGGVRLGRALKALARGVGP